MKQRTFFRKVSEYFSHLMDRVDVIGGNILWYLLLVVSGIVAIIFVVGMITALVSKGEVDIIKIIFR